MKNKKFISVFIFIILNITNLTSSYSIEPDIFIQSTVNRAAKTLSGGLNKDERIKKLKIIAVETVDIDGIGFYSLGVHRKSLNDIQKLEYLKLFKEYFLISFASRLAEYSNPEIQVNSKEKLNKNYTMVSSILVATEQRPEVNIVWRIYTKNPDDLKIRDLIIEGLSLARTQKEEFSSIIQSNNENIDALLDNLKKFIN